MYYYQEVRVVETKTPMSSVIVAKQYIPENTVITDAMIHKESRNNADLMKQKGDLTSKEEKVIGKRTRVPIYANEAVNLQRLMENAPYMDEKDDIKKTMFVISIDNTDKALDIKTGSYIDIWGQPTENGSIAGIKESKPLFQKLKVYGTKTEVYTETVNNVNGQAGNTKQDAIETVTTFLTLYLTDAEIATYLDIQPSMINKRVALYGENAEYKIIGDEINTPIVPAVDTSMGTNHVPSETISDDKSKSGEIKPNTP
jgi:hypothetical protein